MNLIAAIVMVCQIGTASQYAPGVMERVIQVRQEGRTAMALPQVLPPVDGYIAAADCRDIGEVWRLTYRGQTGNYLVSDCAGDARTLYWMRANNIPVEVDYGTAARWQVVGRGAQNVEVCKPVISPDSLARQPG